MKANIYKIVFKQKNDEVDYCGTIPELFERYTYEELGCVIGTVNNAMAKNIGAYENDRVRIVRVTTAAMLEELLPNNALKAII